MENQQRRLYRSRTDKVIAGVCGGLGEYLRIDTTVIRIIWIVSALLGGSGIIIYIIAYFIMPVEPLITDGTIQPVRSNSAAARLFGVVFVVIGLFLLLDNLSILSFHRIWHLSWDYVLPGLLILAGIYYLTNHRWDSKRIYQQAPVGEGETPQPQNSNASGGNENKKKTLRRSVIDKKVLGICGGAGEYFDIDPTIIRIAYVIFTLISGAIGIVLYFLMFLIIPEVELQPAKQI